MKNFCFDGCGVNGPDAYKSRVATLTKYGHELGAGPLLAAAPAMLAVLEGIAALARDPAGSRFTLREFLSEHEGRALLVVIAQAQPNPKQPELI